MKLFKMLSGAVLSVLAVALLVTGTIPVYATTPVSAIIRGVENTDTGIQIPVNIYDNTNALLTSYAVPLDIGTDLTGAMTGKQVNDLVTSRLTTFATNQGWSLATSSIYDLALNSLSIPEEGLLKTIAFTGNYSDLSNLPATSSLSFNNTPSHSIVTTAAAANGWQISSTKNTSVFYSVNVNTTATIAGNADGYVVLEIAATNSTTASDWKEVSRTRNGQSLSLALTLQSVQNIGSELMNIVPAGYYVRLRSVNVSGTPTYTYVSGQEVQL